MVTYIVNKWSLQIQITILVTVAVISVSATLGLSSYFALKRQMHDNLDDKAQSVATITAANLVPGLEFDDRDYIADVVGSLFRDGDIRAVIVYDSTASLIHSIIVDSTLERQLDTEFLKDNESCELRDQFHLALRPIVHMDTYLGKVYIVVRQDEEKSSAADTFIFVIILAIALLIASITVARIAARRILRPIRTFETAAVRVKSSDTLHPIDIADLHPDFLTLGQSFNAMQSRLRAVFTELADSRDQLEFRVRERTKQLEKEIEDRKKNEFERTQRLIRVQLQRTAIAEMTTDDRITKQPFELAARAITEICSHSLNVERVGIWLFENNQEQIKCIDLYDRAADGHSNSMVIPRASAPRYFSHLSHDRVLACDDARTAVSTNEFADAYLIPFGITSMMDASIRISGEFIGIVCCEHIGPIRHWHSDEIKFADEISAQIAQVFAESQRREMEKEQRILNERLEKAERMESLAVLAGGVAHDLNNMLGPVVGYAELLLKSDLTDDKVRKKIERIAASAGSAADVIQDLLALARRGRYEMTHIKLNDVLKSYFDSLSFMQLAKKKPEIDVLVSLTADDSSIFGSKLHLEKVLMNLVHNAFEAITNDGTITVSTEKIRINRLEYTGMEIELRDYMALRVKDSGAGIAPEDMHKIFEPYFSKKVMGHSGSGLGLSVVYGIVKDHKGYYDISSEYTKGTEFVLYFPFSTEEKISDSKTPADDGAVGVAGNETILVVDDSAEQRDISREMLENMGYTVFTAQNGHAGVDFLKTHEVDLVALDMIMEDGFDGLDTFQEILKFKPNQPTIVVSGYSATDRVQTMLNLGASTYVRKPFGFESLGKAVRTTLEADRQRMARSQADA
ncbi:MAG: hypothetical protein CVT49_09465 [candidate division Zixibacteria bacterium HGW-Zixibacteria-1]|nr:MAG: hypothetical protein CVT49_09465 [candidate division Zixibacteria bacterium HGW-Zixibacteria-1]